MKTIKEISQVSGIQDSTILTKLAAGLKLYPMLKKLSGFTIEVSEPFTLIVPEHPCRRDFETHHGYVEMEFAYYTKQTMFEISNKWLAITLRHDKGMYKMVVPCITKFLSAYLNEIGIEPVNQVPGTANSIELSIPLIAAIKKASKFVSIDPLRAALKNVLIDYSFEGYTTVVGTDAHTLYYSNQIQVNTSLNISTKLQLPSTLCKAIAKLKESTTLYFLNDVYYLNNVEYKFQFESSYPDYMHPTIMRKYCNRITAHASDMKQCVKSVDCNKYTHLVKMHVNGAIELSAVDINMGYDAITTMPYSSTTGIEYTIGVNGQYLQKVLSEVNDHLVTIESDGTPTHPLLIHDSLSNYVLMPVMLEA